MKKVCVSRVIGLLVLGSVSCVAWAQASAEQTKTGESAAAVKTQEDYDKAVAAAPDDPQVYKVRGNYFSGKRLYEKALLDYTKVTELEPKNAPYLVAQGQILRLLKRTDEAIGSFSKALEIDPKSTSALNELGTTYMQTKSYDLALDSYTRSLTLKDDSMTYLLRGQMYFDQGKRPLALTDLTKVIESETKRRAANEKGGLSDVWLAQAYFYRSFINARSLSLLSKDEDAVPVIADATKAVQLDPAASNGYLKRAAPMLGNMDAKYGAVALLAGASAAKPGDMELLMKLADAQKDTLNSSSAVESYTKILAVDPKSLAALSGRATASANSARPYHAENWLPVVADWKSYVALKPDDNKAWSQLGIAQYNVGQTAEGIATFKQILAADKENAYAHVILGLGLAISGDKDGALAEAQAYMNKLNTGESKAAKSNAGNANAHYSQNEAVKALFDLLPKPILFV